MLGRKIFDFSVQVSSLTSSPDSSPSPTIASLTMANGGTPGILSDPKIWATSSTSPNSPSSKPFIYDPNTSTANHNSLVRKHLQETTRGFELLENYWWLGATPPSKARKPNPEFPIKVFMSSLIWVSEPSARGGSGAAWFPWKWDQYQFEYKQ